jgi:hypothetical protein
MYRNRYRRILWFFARVILSFIWWDIILFRLGFRRLVRQTRATRFKKMARSFREEAIYLGGVMIKVGQFLSSRLDVLPNEITSELSGLQDEVPPEDFEAIRAEAEQELGGRESMVDAWRKGRGGRVRLGGSTGREPDEAGPTFPARPGRGDAQGAHWMIFAPWQGGARAQRPIADIIAAG